MAKHLLSFFLVAILYLVVCGAYCFALIAYLLGGQEAPEGLVICGYVLGFPFYTALMVIGISRIPASLHTAAIIVSLLLNSGLWSYLVNTLLLNIRGVE